MNKISLPAFEDEMPKKKMSNFQGVNFNTRLISAPKVNPLEEVPVEVIKPQDNVIDINTAMKSTNNKSKKEKKEHSSIERKYYYEYGENDEIVKVNTGLFAEHMVDDYQAITIDNKLYVYKDGFYQQIDRDDAIRIISMDMEPSVRTFSRMLDVFEQWRVHHKLNKHRSEVNKNPYLLNLNNGVFDFKTNTFREGHSPDELMTYRIRANYNADFTKEDGITWHKYLDYVMPNKKTQAVLQEVMGYCITSSVDAKKFFIFQGAGNNGRSKVFGLLESFLDSSNISHVKLQDMFGFKIARLQNKLLNTFADLDNRSIPDASLIKALSGDDEIDADIKHVQEPVTFKSKAKLLFSVNDLPANHGDKSAAFFNRLLIIPFKYGVREEEKDTALFDKFLKEKDYIFMWMMEGLMRLHRNNYVFTESEEVNSAVENYKIKDDTVAQFVHENCILDKNATIHSTFLHELYTRFCVNDLEINIYTSEDYLKSGKFYSYLERHYGVIKKKGRNGDQKQTLYGIAYVKNKTIEIENEKKEELIRASESLFINSGK